jgi:hypothetical protein
MPPNLREDQASPPDAQSLPEPKTGGNPMTRPKGSVAGNGTKINKRQAVREAMEVLGNDAPPGEIQAHLKKAGINLSTNMVSSYKSQIRHKLGFQSKRRRGRPPKNKSDDSVASRTPGDGISIKDLRTIKEMADRLGVRGLKDLFEILYP